MGGKPAPENETRKPPKLKTKVIPPSEFKLFLARKKKERELKLENLRGKKKISDNPPSTTIGDSAALHPFSTNPLSNSAQGTRYDDMSASALSTNISKVYQKLSADFCGIPDLSGKILLAEKPKNLGD